MKPPKNNRITIRLNDEDFARLNEVIKKRQTTASQIVRAFIQKLK